MAKKLRSQPTLIDWSTVDSRIKQCLADFQYDNRSQALTHVLLESLYALSADEITECITDGFNDRGVDAVVIRELSDRVQVDLFQVKCATTFGRAKNNFPSNEIDKVLSFISDLLAKEQSIRDTANSILWGKTTEIWDAFEGGRPLFFNLHFASNMQGLVVAQRRRAETNVKRYRTFEVRIHTLASLASLLIESKRPRLDRNLRVVDDQLFERVDGNIRGPIATIPASELVEMIRNPAAPTEVLSSVFDENVRVYLTSRNRINGRIVESALSDSRSEFWYLNNGITMTCEAVEYQRGIRAPIISMKGVQIVNGGQTSHALFEAAQADQDRIKDVLLLARIYETKIPEISQRVAESTNSQTPIRSRDLRANDEMQRKLEESFSGSSHKCVHDSAPAGRPRRGKRVRMRSCQLTSGEVVCRSVDGRLRGPRF